MTESQIQSAIRKALGRKPDLVLWRYSPGVTDSPNGKRYRAGLSAAGGPDLIGILTVYMLPDEIRRPLECTPVGKWFCLEVKTPAHLRRIRRGTINASDRAQMQFMSLVQRRGGFAAFVDSVESAEMAYERAQRGENE